MATLPGQQADKEKFTLPNLTQRILTGLIFAPLVLLLVVLGGLPFLFMVAFIALIGTLEFFGLASHHPIQGNRWVGVPVALVVLLGFYLQLYSLIGGALITGVVLTVLLRAGRFQHRLGHAAMTLFAVLYVAFPAGFLVALRAEPQGLVWVLLVLFMTWGTDSFAYIGGRLWGKHPLAPIISPKKTFEGALIGVLGGVVPSFILLSLFHLIGETPVERIPYLILIGLGPLVAILGDLVESALKRFFRVKDSHITGLDIFPGHGGVLDRIDALILVSTLTYFYVIVFKLLPG